MKNAKQKYVKGETCDLTLSTLFSTELIEFTLESLHLCVYVADIKGVTVWSVRFTVQQMRQNLDLYKSKLLKSVFF